MDHNLLLNKLSQFGLTGNILQWFKNYLIGRQQRVLLNGVISDTLPISSGVPQGSILGPLLFLIYVNDLPSSISSPSVGISLFADDTKCFSVVESPADACAPKTEARNVEKWALSWRLKFNPQKCKVLSVTRKHHPIVAEYTINSEIMQHVDTQRDLGVTFSSDLKWNKHVHIRTGDQSQSHTRHAQTINGKTLEREHQALSIFNTCKIPSGICLTGLESTKYDHVHGT